MTVRNGFGLSERRQALLVRAMQLGLLAIFAVGLWLGNAGIVVNAAIGLVVTQLPALFERKYSLTLGVGLTLWITAAVFLHALGTVPLPFLGGSAYARTWWWDHLTHVLSSSVVAAVGYTTARVVDEYSEYVSLPPRFLFVYLLLFVMAFGVLWELIEFLTGVVAALLGVGGVLTQYGLGDTMLDFVFDTLGAVIVATVGTAVLTDLVDQLRERLAVEAMD